MPPLSPSSVSLLTAQEHHKAGRLLEAEKLYRQILAADPRQPDALYLLGMVAADSGHADAALELLEKAIRIRPAPYIHLNRARILRRLGRLDEAMASCDAALQLQPGDADAAFFKSGILQEHGWFEASIGWLQRAADVRPDDIDIQNNLGLALMATGKGEQAVAIFRKLIALKPDHFNFHGNLAMALLLLGKFDEGFKEYQWRWDLPAYKAMFPVPLWRGEDIAGKTLLIHGEYGFGDTLQFSRFVPLAAKRGIKTILRVPAPMARLMRSLTGAGQVIASGDAAPAFDFHCSVMDLPAAFDCSPETIPAQIPYIFADKLDLAAWRQRVAASDGAKKIGMVWAGAPRDTPHLNAKDRRRSIAPGLLAPLTRLPGFRFYSLQKDGPRAPPELPVVDLMESCKDFADTAAFVMQLDLVISVDTSVAHLAGALGKPVWLLNRADTCWRWFYEREDSPWYPSMRLFRQRIPGDWTETIERAARALAARSF